MKKITISWKKTGRIASYLPFLLISAFALSLIYGSNEYFFRYAAPSAPFTSKTLNTIALVFDCIATAVILLASVISFIKRKQLAANKAVIWICGIFAVVTMLFAMILMQTNDMFEIAFKNANMYAVYLVLAILSAALPLFSAICNLARIKKEPVTFAKSEEMKKAEKNAASEPAEAAQAE